jgi:hypothetical protein
MLLQNPRSSRWRVGLRGRCFRERLLRPISSSDALISAPPAWATLHRQCRPPAHAAGGALPGRDHPLTSLVVDVGTDASAPTDHQLPRMTSHLAMRCTRGLTRADQVALRTVGLEPHDDHRDACLRIVPSPLSWRVELIVRLRPRKRALAPVRLVPTAAARSTPLLRVSPRLGRPNPSRPCGTRGRHDQRCVRPKTANHTRTIRAPNVRVVTAIVSRFRAASRGARSGSRRSERFGDS